MKKKIFPLLLILIILAAIFWRFTNYSNRWTLSQDQARDAIIGMYSLENHLLPLVGPPSSAGNFSFGPIYYWFIMVFTVIFPFTGGPWIGFTLLSIFSVVLFFYLGKTLGGWPFALISGSVASFTSASVFHSTDMLNPILVSFGTTLALFSLAQLMAGKIKFALLLGFSVGLTINAHFEALGLLSLFILVIFMDSRLRGNDRRGVVYMLTGFILTLIPSFIFNFQTGGQWFSGLFNYFTSGQEKFNVVYSLKSELTFWPKLFGEVLVGIPEAGYLILLITVIAIILAWNKKWLSKFWWIIALSFIFQVVLLHFYKGPRSPVYLIVFHPFIVFLFAWSIWIFWKLNRYLGIVLLAGFLLISGYSNLKIIKIPSQLPVVYSIKEQIDSKRYPSLNIYSYGQSNQISLPLYYLYLKEGKISDQGKKIGACENVALCPTEIPPGIVKDSYLIYELDEPEKLGFAKLTKEGIYNWLFSYYK